MLVLSRLVGEKILIGNDIEITVTEIGRGRVRLGIRAPLDVRIDRQEVREQLEYERAVRPIAAYDLGDPGA